MKEKAAWHQRVKVNGTDDSKVADDSPSVPNFGMPNFGIWDAKLIITNLSCGGFCCCFFKDGTSRALYVVTYEKNPARPSPPSPLML